MDELIGNCHCGKNTFKITNEPEFQFVCYCNNCRLLNSGGHLCGMLFDATHLEPASATQTYEYKGGSGSDIVLHFCPECSTQLYAYPTEYKNKVVIRANALKDANFNPQKALFSESAFPWDAPIGND